MNNIEQLNIEGKRSGEGFVAHKAMLVNALSRAIADRVVVNDITLGRKGLVGYLKALGGSNVVKVTPSNGSASGSQITDKRLRVACGANTSYLADKQWVGDNTPVTLCDVRISPSNSVKPNVGAGELSEALARVLPFTSREDNRPVLQCVYFVAKDGKLTLVGSDGFRLAVVALDFDDTEGEALIIRDDLKGIVNALKGAKRARVGFEDSGEKLGIKSLIIDTELIRYKWVSADGSFPDWQKLIPTEHKLTVRFDTLEAVKAVSSLKALTSGKDYPIDLSIGDGKIVLSCPDDIGQAELVADTDGEAVKIRLDGQYLSDAFRACAGMPELKLTDGKSPALFTTNGYQLLVMPMLTSDSQKSEAKATEQAEAEQADSTEPATEDTEPVAEATEPVKPKKVKRSRAKEPVTV